MSESGAREERLRELIAGLKRSDEPLLHVPPWGFRLVPVTAAALGDDDLLDRVTRWRATNMDNFPTQFPASRERTRAWLRDVVLGAPGRLMLMIETSDGTRVGQAGIDRALAADGSLLLSNCLVGEPSGMPSGAMRACYEALFAWVDEVIRPTGFSCPFFPQNRVMARLLRSLGFADLRRVPMRRVERDGQIQYLPVEPGDDAPPDRWWIWVGRTPLVPGFALGTVGLAADASVTPDVVERTVRRQVPWIAVADAATEAAVGRMLADHPAAARPELVPAEAREALGIVTLTAEDILATPALEAVARGAGCSPEEVVVAWTLARPGVAAVAAPAASPADVSAWGSGGRVRLSDTERRAVDVTRD